MKPQIRRWFEESAETKLKFVAEHADRVQQLADLLVETFQRGNKVLLFGNGGSAMDASHLAAEFVGRYRRERKPLADRKSTRLNSSHIQKSRMPSSA